MSPQLIQLNENGMHSIRHFYNTYEGEIPSIFSLGIHLSCFQLNENKDECTLHFLVRGHWGQSETLKEINIEQFWNASKTPSNRYGSLLTPTGAVCHAQKARVSLELQPTQVLGIFWEACISPSGTEWLRKILYPPSDQLLSHSSHLCDWPNEVLLCIQFSDPQTAGYLFPPAHTHCSFFSQIFQLCSLEFHSDKLLYL